MTSVKIQSLKCIFARIMLCVMFFSAVIFYVPANHTVLAASGFDGGDGTLTNPYRISRVEQFQNVILGPSGAGIYYVLTCSINTPSNQKRPLIDGDFYGVFDGNGYNLSMKQMLCNRIMSGGVVRNLCFTTNISGDLTQYGQKYDASSYFIGTFAGYSYGTIDNCQGTCYINVTSSRLTYAFAAGFVGVCESGTITNCGISAGQLHITSNSFCNAVSGLMAQSRGAYINNCFVVAKMHVNGSSTASDRNYAGCAIAALVGTKQTSLYNTFVYNTALLSDYSGGSLGTNLQMGAIICLDSGYKLSAANFKFRSARDPSGEWVLGTSPNNISGQLERITSDPGKMLTSICNGYRRWASSTSYNSYSVDTYYGRSTVVLNQNGGEGANASYTKIIGSSVSLPVPFRYGYRFIGWGTSATATSPAYEPGVPYNANSNVTLYALWEIPEVKEINYDTLEISNKVTVLDRPAHSMIPADVDNDANLTALRVYLTDPADEISIYRMADITFNNTIHIFDRPCWVPEVVQWNADHGKNYSSPLALSNAVASEQKSYFTYMFYGNESNIITGPSYNLPRYIPRTYSSDHSGIFALTSDEIELLDSSEEPVLNITGMEPGEYIVLASNGTRQFTPFVVNISPEREGTTSSFYLFDYYEVRLKAAGANVTKYIVAGDADSNSDLPADDPTDVHMDTAARTDVKEFRIVVDLPTYKDRITISANGSAQPYTMMLTDLMDESMSLIRNTEAASLAESIAFYYQDTDGSLKPLPTGNVTYQEYTTPGYSGSTAVTADMNAAMAGNGIITRSAPLYQITEITTSQALAYGVNGTGFTVNFNIAAFKSWATENGFTAIPGLELRYCCLITDKIKVASENNINHVEILYEVTDDGTNTLTQEDSVHLYTYGIALHKLDGDTNLPLAGAGFYLYKRIGEFRQINSSDTFVLTDPQYADKIPDTFTSIDDFQSEPVYYLYRYTETDEGSDNVSSDAPLDPPPSEDNGIEVIADPPEGFLPEEESETEGVTTPQEITAVFIRLDYIGADGSLITAVDASGQNPEGNFFDGLDAGQYILQEYQTPSGYNRLSDDMLFEIRKFTTDEATTKGITLSSYKDGAGNAISSGRFDIVVLNYTGFTLPSTGGMGTLLFTIVGLGITSMAVAICAVKRKIRSDSIWDCQDL